MNALYVLDFSNHIFSFFPTNLVWSAIPAIGTRCANAPVLVLKVGGADLLSAHTCRGCNAQWTTIAAIERRWTERLSLGLQTLLKPERMWGIYYTYVCPYIVRRWCFGNKLFTYICSICSCLRTLCSIVRIHTLASGCIYRDRRVRHLSPCLGGKWRLR